MTTKLQQAEMKARLLIAALQQVFLECSDVPTDSIVSLIEDATDLREKIDRLVKERGADD